MKFLSVATTAEKWNISARSVRNYCKEGRIPGAFLTGKTWNIPETAQKPDRKTRIPNHLNLYQVKSNHFLAHTIARTIRPSKI